MVEHPHGESDHTEPDHTEPSTSDEENPRGLLFISDVQALRRADTVHLHAADGVGLVDAYLTSLAGDEARVFTAKEQQLFPDPVGRDRRRRIEVAADIAGFDRDRRWHDHQLPGATASTVIAGADFHDVWRSAAAFLRVGDVLRLRWHAGNNTDQLTVRGLFRDELHLEVRRGKRLWTFLLDMSVRPSAARTVATENH